MPSNHLILCHPLFLLLSIFPSIKVFSNEPAFRIRWPKYWSHHFMANRWGNNGNSERLYFGGLQNHCGWQQQPSNYKMLVPWKKSYDQPRQHIKKQRQAFFQAPWLCCSDPGTTGAIWASPSSLLAWGSWKRLGSGGEQQRAAGPSLNAQGDQGNRGSEAELSEG